MNNHHFILPPDSLLRLLSSCRITVHQPPKKKMQERHSTALILSRGEGGMPVKTRPLGMALGGGVSCSGGCHRGCCGAAQA